MHAEVVRIGVVWGVVGRSDRRSIDRAPAIQVLYCIVRYLADRSGDIKMLKPPRTGFQLRCGDYRVFFDNKAESLIEVTAIRHRREAYRRSSR